VLAFDNAILVGCVRAGNAVLNALGDEMAGNAAIFST
jgi:hypothetical protein